MLAAGIPEALEKLARKAVALNFEISPVNDIDTFAMYVIVAGGRVGEGVVVGGFVEVVLFEVLLVGGRVLLVVGRVVLVVGKVVLVIGNVVLMEMTVQMPATAVYPVGQALIQVPFK